MTDVFDEIAEQLGITRTTAIKNYCAVKVTELTQEKEVLALALHLLAENLRREYPATISKLVGQLEKQALNDPTLAPATHMLLAVLQKTH